MRLRTDAVLLAVFKTEIRRGTAVDLLRVLREARMPLVRLERVPIERDGRHVEILPKDPAVLRVLLFRLELVEHEDVGAVPEVVRFLSHTDLRAGNRLAVSVNDLNRREALACVLDSGGGALLYYVLVIAERFQHIFFPCHCIFSLSKIIPCNSVHGIIISLSAVYVNRIFEEKGLKNESSPYL